MSFNPKWIVGKRVARVDMGTERFRAAGQVVTMHNPYIHFDDGSCIRFFTEENPDGGEYGTGIAYYAANEQTPRDSTKGD